MKKLFTIVALATATAFAAPAMADDDARIYAQNQAQYISYEKAGQVAKDAVKGEYVKKVEFDYSRKRGAHFDVDVIGAQGLKYEVVVDAKTGKVLYSEIDD